MLRASAVALALGFLAAPVTAGEFFTGTRSESSRFDNARTSTGHESIESTRHFNNEMSGSSHKKFVNISASAENARYGTRQFGFAEGDAEIDASLIGLGEASLGLLGGNAQGAAFGQLGLEVDGMAGTGTESYLDGSLNANAEWGGANSTYKIKENGRTKFRSRSDFSEVSIEDGTRSSGGSVFSFN